MQLPFNDSASEVELLRGFMNNVNELRGLQASWDGAAPARISRTLIDALVEMLGLDLACVLATPVDGSPPVELVSEASLREAGEAVALLRAALGHDIRAWPARTTCRLAGIDYSIATAQLGGRGEAGVVVAVSSRAGFPLESESLLLEVVVKQTSTSTTASEPKPRCARASASPSSLRTASPT